jgi:adenylosuccinate synthase
LGLVRYTNLINGYNSINLTKLDILDELDEIKVGVKHTINGKTIDSLPGTLEEFKKVEIKYETLKGWKRDISKVTKAEDLPK